MKPLVVPFPNAFAPLLAAAGLGLAGFALGHALGIDDLAAALGGAAAGGFLLGRAARGRGRAGRA